MVESVLGGEEERHLEADLGSPVSSCSVVEKEQRAENKTLRDTKRIRTYLPFSDTAQQVGD